MSRSTKVDEFIAAQSSWQREHLEIFRALVHEVFSNVVEDIKWGVPVFLKVKSPIFAMSTFKGHTKFNFFEGAALEDKHKLFNSGLDSKKHRSINLAEDVKIDKVKLIELIEEALQHSI